MIEGLDRFKTHFAEYTDKYILIGGAACTVAMENVGQIFRATKDLDIVLCIEALDADFGAAFWQFVRDGGYQSQEKGTRDKQFYRFEKPTTAGYPVMLELFARTPDVLVLAEGSHLTPIPINEEISSLSAILMDDDYYNFLQSGKQIVDDVQIARAEHLIPLKARAWLDLTARKDAGAHVDSDDVKKHKLDVFRLLTIVDPDFGGDVPERIKADISVFVERMKDETVDLKAAGLGNRQLDEVLTELRGIYGLS